MNLATLSLCLLAMMPVGAMGATVVERPVSFRLDVMPVFFRAGCNSGGCHGAAAGKDGFHLSLFGYDPDGDYWRITQQIVGRRIDLARPEQSLLLLKATGMVPHTGGRRIKPGSEYYDTLLHWVQTGALDDSASVPQVTALSLIPDKIIFSGKPISRPLQVVARYSDGSTRTVNRLALYMTNNKATVDIDEQGNITPGKRGDTFVFARFSKYTVGAEVIVLPQDKHFHWPKVPVNNYIDQLVDAKLRQLRIIPSGLATDEEFLRRVYLDLIGLPPTPQEYQRFIASREPDKRACLVDELLAREEFADLWAAQWAEMLKVSVNYNDSYGMDTKAAESYYHWIREQVGKDTPLDEFVKAQLAGKGSNLRDPPVNLYTMLPQEHFDPKAFAQDVAQLFTGIRIQCAQCHNHPFDRWTQDDYYSFVSFFTGVKRKFGSEAREFYIYDDPNEPPAKHLLDGRPMPAKFLGGDVPILKDAQGKALDPRLVLANWLVADPLFRQNLANRIWAHFFGRGIVEPVDDVRVSNPPVNRQLLEALGGHLAGDQFYAKRIIRDICTSRTYQLSVATNDSNRDDEQQFSHGRLRRLRADVLLDAISQVTGSPTSFNYFPNGLRAVQLFDGGRRAYPYFLKAFGLAQRDSVNASDTHLEPTLSQALHLVNGDTIEAKLNQSTVIPDLLKSHRPPEELIDEIFIRTLSRKPSATERQRLLALIGPNPVDRKPYDDIFWALLNSTEFAFNH